MKIAKSADTCNRLGVYSFDNSFIFQMMWMRTIERDWTRKWGVATLMSNDKYIKFKSVKL